MSGESAAVLDDVSSNGEAGNTHANGNGHSVQTLRVANIRIDGGTQSRAAIDEPTVQEYAGLVRSVELPPVTVYFDGVDYWLADGFHRYLSAKRAEMLSIKARVIAGTRRDAILHAAGANSTHGLKRSPADKRHAVAMLLADAEWSKKTDRWIAQKCAVGHGLVADVRRELFGDAKEGETRVGIDGKERAVPQPKSKSQEKRVNEQLAAQPVDGEPRDAAQLAAQPVDSGPSEQPDFDDLEPTDEELAAIAAEEEASEGNIESTSADPVSTGEDPVQAGLNTAKEFDSLCRSIQSSFNEAKRLSEGWGGAFFNEEKLEEFRVKLGNAVQVLKDCKPHAKCGYCKGRGCKTCHQCGYLTRIKAQDAPE